MADDRKIAERLSLFEQGLANAAIEGHCLSGADEAQARALIEEGLAGDELAAAMDAYFDANPLKKRQVASGR